MLVITVILSKLKEGEEDTEGGGKQAAEHEISTLHKAYLLFYMPVAALNAWRACIYEMNQCSVIIIQPLPLHTYHTYGLTAETRLVTLTPQIILSCFFFVCVITGNSPVNEIIVGK